MKALIPHRLESLLLAALNPSLGWLRCTRGVSLRGAARLRWLKKMGHLAGVTQVVDAGANEGAFARSVAAVLPEAAIYCFEPVPATFARLQRNTAALPNVELANVALGPARAQVPMYTCPLDEANSLLRGTRALTDAWNETAPTGQVEVEVWPLDDFLAGKKAPGKFFLKADVQGYELELLKGAAATLRRCALLQLETSLVPLYESAPTLPQLWQFVVDAGFEFLMLGDVLTSRQNRQPVSCDLYFSKPARLDP